MRTKITPELVEEMKRLRADGKTYKQIGSRMKLHEDTVYTNINPLIKEKANQAKKRYQEKHVERIKINTAKNHKKWLEKEQEHKKEMITKYFTPKH